jgi:hypothetical protein
MYSSEFGKPYPSDVLVPFKVPQPSADKRAYPVLVGYNELKIYFSASNKPL